MRILFSVNLFCFSICNMFFVSKGNLLEFYFTSLQLELVPCSGRRTSPVLRHSAGYIFISFGIIAYGCIFGNGVLLMFTLKGGSSVENIITAYEESQ